MTKTAPYPSRHRDNFPAKVPGLLAGWLRQVTGLPCRLAPRYPDIACRDFTLGPLYCRAVIFKPLNHLQERYFDFNGLNITRKALNNYIS